MIITHIFLHMQLTMLSKPFSQVLSQMIVSRCIFHFIVIIVCITSSESTMVEPLLTDYSCRQTFPLIEQAYNSE